MRSVFMAIRDVGAATLTVTGTWSLGLSPPALADVDAVAGDVDQRARFCQPTSGRAGGRGWRASVGGAIAPPGVELVFRRMFGAGDVGEFAFGRDAFEAVGLDRGVAHSRRAAAGATRRRSLPARCWCHAGDKSMRAGQELIALAARVVAGLAHALDEVELRGRTCCR